MSDGIAARIAYVGEPSFGGDVSGLALNTLRLVNEDIGSNTETTQSNEIREDGQIPDIVRTSISGGGPLNFEFSYGAHDTLLAAGVRKSAFAAALQVTGSDIAFAATGNKITSTTTDKFNTLVPGAAIKISGAGAGTNGGKTGVVLSRTTGANPEVVIIGLAIATQAAGATVDLDQGEHVVNGTDFPTFAVEKEFTDLSNVFDAYPGQGVSAFALSVAVRAISTGSVTFFGSPAIDPRPTATIGNGTYNAPAANDVMNAIDNIDAIKEGNTALDVTAFSISLENSLRGREKIGALGPQSLGRGRVAVSGTLQAFFETTDLLDRYRQFTRTPITLFVTDAAGNSYVVALPSIRFTSGRAVVPGEEDVITDLGWEASRHPTGGYTIGITRFDAP